MMLAQIVANHPDLADAFFLVALILAALAAVAREYAGLAAPVALAFLAAGLFVL